MRHAAPRSKIAESLTLLAFLVAVGEADDASARGKRLECAPEGLPMALGAQGSVEVMQAVEYLGGTRIVTADKALNPRKLRLVSLSGESTSLATPPWTVKPSRWLSRGRVVYAVGTGRSLTEGQTDVVLVRWGSDSRPRLTKVRTASAVGSDPRAALVDERMAVLWTEPASDQKAHVKVSFIDLEEVSVGEPQDLGLHADGGLVEMSAVDKGFVALWSSPEGLMRRSFDAHGKSSGAASAQPWKSTRGLRGAIACGERVWLLQDSGADKVTVSASNTGGEFAPVGQLDASAIDASLSMLCMDDGIMVAHRTVSPKQGNVVFWISSVEATGKVRGRRVKDVQGTPDDIRLPQLVATSEGRTALWVEGTGEAATVWSRAIACN
jgi:hypothetical protein